MGESGERGKDTGLELENGTLEEADDAWWLEAAVTTPFTE
jgi:hypothetical protein